MEPMPKGNAESPKTNGVIHLRAEVYEALAARKGLTKVKDQAERHGIGRQHLSALKAHRKGLGLALALQMAADLDTSVEALCDRRTS